MLLYSWWKGEIWGNGCRKKFFFNLFEPKNSFFIQQTSLSVFICNYLLYSILRQLNLRRAKLRSCFLVVFGQQNAFFVFAWACKCLHLCNVIRRERSKSASRIQRRTVLIKIGTMKIETKKRRVK